MNNAKGEDQRDTGGNRPYIQRYRAKHKRIDYVPSVEVLAIIEAWRVRKLDNCIAGVIDRLIHAGNAALSGNADSTQPGGMLSTQQDISGKVAPS
jgi:hypothetical protein